MLAQRIRYHGLSVGFCAADPEVEPSCIGWKEPPEGCRQETHAALLQAFGQARRVLRVVRSGRHAAMPYS